MTLQWVTANIRSGEFLEDLPDLGVDTLTHSLGQDDSTTVKFPVVGKPGPPSNWLYSTKPYTSMLVALDSSTGLPTDYAGMVVQRTRTVNGPVELSLTTTEGYLRRRFIRDTLQYPQTDRLTIGQDLLTRYVIDGASGRNGLPLRVVVLGDGPPADGDFKDTDDKSVLSAFQDLGFEWTFALELLHSPERVGIIAYLGERIGNAVMPGQKPQATFDYPGNVMKASVVEDYSEGKGGNDVLATSSGQGSVRPQSTHETDVDSDMPTVEMRKSAGSNIVSLAALNAYASSVLAQVAPGSTGYTATIMQSAPAAKRFGMGDDVGIDFSGPEFPDHPVGIPRVIGIARDNLTVTPIFATPGDTSGS